MPTLSRGSRAASERGRPGAGTAGSSGDRPTERIEAVRAFNRFYTAITGLLQEGFLETPYSLTDVRVIFELAQEETTELSELRRALQLDAGYLSRLISRLEEGGLLTRASSSTDRRRQLLRLTPAGRKAFRQLDQRAAEQVASLLGRLRDEQQRALVGAMATIRSVLGQPEADPGLVVLREPEPGELGWIVYRHGALYAEEYGWDSDFEALVARIVAEFMERGDWERERAWIAEQGGKPVGCVLCTRKSHRVAQLRLLLVEPEARNRGIGSRLVEQCLGFARRAGYGRITLWTNDVLEDARRIYERSGFVLEEKERHHSFGNDLVGQYWSKEL
jgi:DNA-binding MarR family transcriptional regulator/RimJ/RimL family protein N-acetyltransferase